MPNVDYFCDESPTLRSALLIYSSGSLESTREKDEIVVTQHAVEQGVIQPGQPLDLDAFRTLIDGRSTVKMKARTEWTWHFPRLLAENQDWRVWWSMAGEREVFIGYDEKKPKVIKAWIPGLVWAARRTAPTCYLFAYDGPAAPNKNTDVYQPRFGPEDGLNHIFANSSICMGTMKLADNTPQSWEDSFWSSRFKVPGNALSRNQPYACKEIFKRIGTVESALSRCRASD